MAPLRSLDSETLDVDDTVGGIPFTAAKITTAVLMAECIVTKGIIRVSCDAALTILATNGQPYGIGGAFQVWGAPDLGNFKAIREGSTDGELAVEYFGEGS